MLAHALIAALAVTSLSPAASPRNDGSHLSKHAIRHKRAHRKHVSRMPHTMHFATAAPSTVQPAQPAGFLDNLPAASLSNEKDGCHRQAALDLLAAMPNLEPQPSAAPPPVPAQPTDHRRKASRRQRA